MVRTHVIVLAFAALLPLCGCKTTATPTSPTSTTSPASQPTPPPVSDAARQEDERFKREVEAKRRKSHSADIDKTNAYRNYVP